MKYTCREWLPTATSSGWGDPIYTCRALKLAAPSHLWSLSYVSFRVRMCTGTILWWLGVTHSLAGLPVGWLPAVGSALLASGCPVQLLLNTLKSEQHKSMKLLWWLREGICTHFLDCQWDDCVSLFSLQLLIWGICEVDLQDSKVAAQIPPIKDNRFYLQCWGCPSGTLGQKCPLNRWSRHWSTVWVGIQQKHYKHHKQWL